MVTEFGRIIRIYRIQHNLILKDMADALNVPSSYLSAMEMGRRPVTKEFLEKLLSIYDFTEEEVISLREAAEKSVILVKVNLQKADNKKRDMALSFARRFDDMDEETVRQIMEFLK